jgi:hypothetical protein
MVIQFIQINLNHAIAPTAEVGSIQNCVYLLQEQHYFSIRNKRNLYAAKCSFEHGLTRAGIYISAAKTFTFLPLNKFTGRDFPADYLSPRSSPGQSSSPLSTWMYNYHMCQLFST